MTCSNPNCPVHSPRAAEIRARVVTNLELMNVIRCLAVNAHNRLASVSGIPPQQAMVFQAQLIAGHHDDEEIIQGLIDGFVRMLLESHPQVMSFAGLTAAVKEGESFLDRNAAETRALLKEKGLGPQKGPEIVNLGDGLIGVAGTFDDLMRFLGSQR